MCGDSGGALVLILIVRNFQVESCNQVTVKFVDMSILIIR